MMIIFTISMIKDIIAKKDVKMSQEEAAVTNLE
jgi:hypothetical protein